MRIRERLRSWSGRPASWLCKVGVWARGTAEALEDKAKLLRLEAAEKRLARREGDLAIRFTGAAPMDRTYVVVADARALVAALIARVRERLARKAFAAGVWTCAGGIANLAELCAAAGAPEIAVAEADFPDFPMGLPAECVRSFTCPVCGERPGAEIRSEASAAPAEIGSGMGWAIHCGAGHLFVRSGRMGT